MTWYDGEDAPTTGRGRRTGRHAPDRAPDRAPGQALDRAVGQATGRALDHAVGQALDHAVDQVPDQARDQALDQVVGEAPGARAGATRAGGERGDHRPRRPRTRWRAAPRVAVGAVLALALVGGAVALRSAAAAPTGTAVTLGEPRASASGTVADPDDAADAGADAGAVDSGGASPTGPGSTDGSTSADALGSTATDPDDAGAAVVVHVVGQVASPGVVTLRAGARVTDALDAAGGALPEADLAALNLAEVLTDGVQVRVPLPGESTEPAAPVGTGAAGTGDATGTGGASGAAAGLVDVNTASATELDALPGIGPVLAERIVQWRTDHGRFSTVDDLQQVSGIGPTVLDKLRDQVRV